MDKNHPQRHRTELKPEKNTFPKRPNHGSKESAKSPSNPLNKPARAGSGPSGLDSPWSGQKGKTPIR